MYLTIFKYKIRVEYILLSILLVWFIHANTFFSCAGGVKPGVKVIKEGFTFGGNIVEGLTQKVTEKGKKETKKVVKAAGDVLAAAASKTAMESTMPKATVAK